MFSGEPVVCYSDTLHCYGIWYNAAKWSVLKDENVSPRDDHSQKCSSIHLPSGFLCQIRATQHLCCLLLLFTNQISTQTVGGWFLGWNVYKSCDGAINILCFSAHFWPVLSGMWQSYFLWECFWPGFLKGVPRGWNCPPFLPHSSAERKIRTEWKNSCFFQTQALLHVINLVKASSFLNPAPQPVAAMETFAGVREC